MTGALALDLASAVLLVVGASFAVIGGIGLVRLPDFFTRMHGAGITDTLGAGLIIAGLMLQSGFSLATVKLVFIIMLLWLTSPTATHALAKAALTSGLEPHLAEPEEAPSPR